MRFLTAITALAGAIGTALAQTSDFHALTRPGMNEQVPAGKTYTVTWNVAEKYGDEKVVIGLLGGNSGSSLHPLGTIGTADGSDGSFTWSVDSSLGTEKTYGLVISLASDTSIYQYSTPFSIEGGGKAATTEKSSTAEPTSTKTKDKTTTSPTPESTTTKTKEKTTSSTEETTSTSTTSTEETTSTPETTHSSSTTTSFMTVTAPTSGSTSPTTSEASPSASATSEPDDESGGGGKFLGLSTGAWVGIGAGGLAGVLLLIAIAVKAVRMKRSREHDRYQDIDRQY